MPKTYLDVINDARDEITPGTIPLSRLTDTDAEVKRSRSCIQRALRDLLARHLAIPSESKIGTVTTTTGNALLTNLISDPWDTKMVMEMHYLDTTQTPNVRRRVLPITEAQSKDLLLLTYTDTTPRYYYQKGNNLYLVPVPQAAYSIDIRYNRTVPLIAIEDLTTQLDLDNEGILVLTDLTKAHLLQGKDPEWEKILGMALKSVDVYYERLNYGQKKQGVNGTMKVQINRADWSY